MLAVIFMQKPTGIVVLVFLARTFKPYEQKFLCPHLQKCRKPIEPYRRMLLFSFQDSSVDNIKVLGIFHENFTFAYLEN